MPERWDPGFGLCAIKCTCHCRWWRIYRSMSSGPQCLAHTNEVTEPFLCRDCNVLPRSMTYPSNTSCPMTTSLMKTVPSRKGAGGALRRANPSDAKGKVTIDLARLERIDGPEGVVLHRYLASIQAQRQNFQGPTITIRAQDLHIIASLMGVTPDHMNHRLDELGLRP